MILSFFAVSILSFANADLFQDIWSCELDSVQSDILLQDGTALSYPFQFYVYKPRPTAPLVGENNVTVLYQQKRPRDYSFKRGFVTHDFNPVDSYEENAPAFRYQASWKSSLTKEYTFKSFSMTVEHPEWDVVCGKLTKDSKTQKLARGQITIDEKTYPVRCVQHGPANLLLPRYCAFLN